MLIVLLFLFIYHRAKPQEKLKRQNPMNSTNEMNDTVHPIKDQVTIDYINEEIALQQSTIRTHAL